MGNSNTSDRDQFEPGDELWFLIIEPSADYDGPNPQVYPDEETANERRAEYGPIARINKATYFPGGRNG